jgi:hypothetical protein
MNNDISNIILEERIKNSLFEKAPEGFPDKILREIRLNEEFAKEDKKSFKTVKYVMGTFAILFVAFGISLALNFSVQYEEVKNTEGSLLNQLTNFFTGLSSNIISAIGFGESGMGLIYIIFIMLFIVIFSLSDKYIFRKT